ncbi:MAG: hypothetical protein AAGC93_08615 [Cyanobacteria bacterium P01_F01_bin.53]
MKAPSNKTIKFRQRQWYLLWLMLTALFLVLLSSPAQAQDTSFAPITFRSLGVIAAPGRVEFSEEVVATLGFDPGRQWQTGTPISDLITLGDVASLGIQQLSLADIARLSGHTPKSVSAKGLSTVALVQSQHWQQMTIASIPYLPDVPLSLLPGGLANSVPLTQLDIVLGTVEANINRTISGSQQQGFSVPCAHQCAHLELGQPYPGYRWVGGQQQVRGGYGFLSALNNGLEPTGRHLWGTDAFKVVVTNLDPANGQAELSLYFRICIHSLWVNSCSPYFIGPVPFMPLHEGGWMPV